MSAKFPGGGGAGPFLARSLLTIRASAPDFDNYSIVKQQKLS